MNSTLTGLAAATVLSGFALSGVGDEVNGPDRNGGASGIHWQPVQGERLGLLMKGSKIVGAEVKNSQDEKLGKIQELAIDLEAGRVVEVIVSAGGVLGVGDKLVAIPTASFKAKDEQSVILDLDKARLKEATEFDGANWDSSLSPGQVARTYREYGLAPYFQDRADRTGTAALSTDRMGYAQKASRLIGFPVENRQGEKVGKVNDLLVDLHSGRVVQAVVSAGGFLGIGNELNFVPPEAFRYNAEHSALVLDVTRESLGKAPRFNGDEWTAAADPAGYGDIYEYYRVKPYFSTKPVEVDNTRRNSRDRDDRHLTPLDQGNNEADLTLTKNIRTAVRQTTGLSVNAQNVKIITRGGQVTLRGPVNSDAEKAAITAIVRRYADKGRVDNQLEVKVAEDIAR